MFKITIEGQPIPASRPRVSYRGTYYNKKYSDYLKGLTEIIWVKSQPYKRKFPLTGDLKIMCIFSRKGKKRCDLDNLQKAVWDALQKANIIQDDNQFVEATAKVYYNMAKPYTQINIWNKN